MIEAQPDLQPDSSLALSELQDEVQLDIIGVISLPYDGGESCPVLSMSSSPLSDAHPYAPSSSLVNPISS